MYPLLATFILTGERKSEVLGLEVDDVSLRLKKTRSTPNGSMGDWRRYRFSGPPESFVTAIVTADK